MINALELYRQIKDQWDTTSQPIKERASVLALGQYEDGSVGLAWPGLLAAPAQGVANFGQYGYGEDAVPYNTRMAFDAAGGAMTGGLGVGLAGGLADNAVGSAGAKITGNALERAQPQGIRAYHGSPHSFDRFDLSKIGTGEGAQAYGHGLYFAESEDVARSYRDQLSDYSDAVKWKGEQSPTPLQQSLLNQLGGPDVRSGRAMTVDMLKRELWRMVRDAEHGMFPDAKRAAKFREQAEELKRIESLIETKPPGRMYEVNIRANPEDFLDWDKPLSQQSEKAKALLAKTGLATNEADRPDLFKVMTLDGTVLQEYQTAEQAQRYLAANPGFRSERMAASGDLTIEEIVKRKVGAGSTDPVAATNALREAGIPGIRYLDGMSRGAGEGSSNYVVFDDALVDILRKYANAPTGSSVPLAVNALERAQPQIAKGTRPEPDALIPKAEAMGHGSTPQSSPSGSLAETAPATIADFIARVNELVNEGVEGPFFGPRYQGATESEIEAAYQKAFRRELDRRSGRFNDWEYADDGTRTISPYYENATMFGDKATHQYSPYVASGIEDAAKQAGRNLPMYQASGGSSYGTLSTPAGNTYKVRVADHARTSSQFDKPDFNIAPGAMTPDDFIALLPAIYSNAPTGAALPVGMEASQQDTDPALLDYLRAVGLY